MTTTLALGNDAALDAGRPMAPGNRITSCQFDEGMPFDEQVAAVIGGTHGTGFWEHHSLRPSPVWVESNDPNLAEALSAHYGCPIGRPDDTWE